MSLKKPAEAAGKGDGQTEYHFSMMPGIVSRLW
jgi:hypothetical protein